jgi:hypothetical protein
VGREQATCPTPRSRAYVLLVGRTVLRSVLCLIRPEVINVIHRLGILLLICMCFAVSTASAQGMGPADATDRSHQLSPDVQAQNARLETMLSYENGKKDVGVAVILGLLIPGAGDMYAGSTGTGILLFGAAIAGFVIGTNGDPYTGQAILVAAVITSPFSAGMSASGHN